MLKCKYLFTKRKCKNPVISQNNICIKTNKPCVSLCDNPELIDVIENIDHNKCIDGEYTDIPFNGCKTCGKTYRVICSNENISPKIRNSGGCRPGKCPHFESVKLNTLKQEF